jgi:hypothetical protein
MDGNLSGYQDGSAQHGTGSDRALTPKRRFAFGYARKALILDKTTAQSDTVVNGIAHLPCRLLDSNANASEHGICAGGDNGITKMWNRREISVSSYYDRSHYLHPHPVHWGCAVQRLAISRLAISATACRTGVASSVDASNGRRALSSCSNIEYRLRIS